MEVPENLQIYGTVSVMPDGTPVPDVMTAAEVVRFLRLDEDGIPNPEKTLRYYREKKLLRAIRIGRHLRYSRFDLLEFLRKVRV